MEARCACEERVFATVAAQPCADASLQAVRAVVTRRGRAPCWCRPHDTVLELDGVNLDEWGWARNNADEFVQAMSCRQNFMDIALEWEDLVRIETDKRAFLVRDVNDIAGLPQFLREDMSNAAVHRGYPASTPETGPWLVMHVPAMVEPILRHATQRKFRDFVYSTHARIGYTGGTGDGDTTEMLDKLLGERLKYANLLGFPTYADLAFTLKMGTKQQVYAFLGRLRRESLPVARRQLAELQQFATSQGAGHQLEHFDLEYWRERLLESRLGLSEGYLRDFFQLPTVLDGLFGLLRRLFGVRFVREEAPAESKWDPHVIFYRLVDEDSGVVMSSLFIDPYSRRWRKKPGFAVEPIQHRSTITPLADNFTEAGARKAAVTIVCDFLPPRQEGDVALLTHRDVAKLFHTMGGALRTLLTNTTTGLMADDTYLELDAQSMPAHFLERWAFDKTTLRSMSSHVETGDSLPEPAIDAIVSSRSFHRTISMLRRVFQAQVDLDLHAQYDPNGEMTTQDVAKLIEAEFSVIPPRTRDHELNSWPLHAERGCGLYSDLWSEALAADAFAVFEASGLEDAEAVGGLGRRFRGCILAPAAGRSPAGGLQEFLGRPLSLATFLRAHGVAPGRAGASGEGPAAGFDDYEDIYEDDADFVELEAYDEPEEDGDSAEREDDVEADVPDATG
ncbi:unnamed protein product [Prorocentrum cordatum]|uniref:Peptidase M3A/M3B catalytic domain-containing protein n=1 Tax=Prorocentrum cordatum TaxID=2364126 RepID=A0ABN9U458_9DINO|nr:unnamed protein product [Polarella glacialis]